MTAEPRETTKAERLRLRRQCRACGAAILWTRTKATGARMPVDAGTSDDGNVVLTVEGGELVAEVLGKEGLLWPPAVGTRHKPHHATCDKAGAFRRLRRMRQARQRRSQSG